MRRIAMNKKIYFDNAATSFPKPAAVTEAMIYYLTELGVNINRGCYDNAFKAEDVLFETRELICELFGGNDPRNVVFTKNITESLNFVIKGLLQPGDHVLVSSMEHNAVMRPLMQLTAQGITFDRIPCAPDGSMDPASIEPLIKPNTRAVILLHASNVCGTILPIPEIGKLCAKNGLIFIVDSAQSAGVLDLNMEDMHIDALCFTGHKSLLGPQGIGGFVLKEHMINMLTPLISGGTGSISHTELIPEFMPDRFEAGTMNLPGIFGLNAALKYLNSVGISTIRKQETDLTRHMLQELSALETAAGQLRIVGKNTTEGRTSVISISTPNHDPAQVAFDLDQEFSIMTRVGLHCAPSAHKTLGTFPTGTIRFSFGPHNTHDEIDLAIGALKTILSR